MHCKLSLSLCNCDLRGERMDVKAALGGAVDTAMDSRVAGLSAPRGQERDVAKIKKLANEFESVFLEQMLKGMRSTVQKGGLVDGGNAEEVYTSMLDSEYSKIMAGQRGSGIADMIERQLLQTMGVKSGVSGKSTQTAGIRAYHSAPRTTLQREGKPVTMESGSPAIMKAVR